MDWFSFRAVSFQKTGQIQERHPVFIRHLFPLSFALIFFSIPRHGPSHGSQVHCGWSFNSFVGLF